MSIGGKHTLGHVVHDSRVGLETAAQSSVAPLAAVRAAREGLGPQGLDEHNRLIRAQFDRCRGHEVNTTGDGFLATFASAVGALPDAVPEMATFRDLRNTRFHGTSLRLDRLDITAERRVPGSSDIIATTAS